jgi:putative transposase
MEVPEVKRLKSLEEENARLKKLLAKPCWIKRRFRWLLGESTDDRPEAGSRDVDV